MFSVLWLLHPITFSWGWVVCFLTKSLFLNNDMEVFVWCMNSLQVYDLTFSLISG